MTKTLEVGLENLPNCYIKLIEIEEVSEDSRKHIIHIVIKDIRDEHGKYLWYLRDGVYEYMKIVALFTGNSQYANDLDTGLNDIIDVHSSHASHSYQTILSLDGAEVEKINEVVVPEGTLCSFLYKIEIVTPNVYNATRRRLLDGRLTSGQQPVKLYAAVMIDFQDRFRQYRIIPDSLRIYHGPVTSEIVYEKSPSDETPSNDIDLRQANQPQTSYAFLTETLKPEKEAVPGPVHIIEQVVNGQTDVTFAAGSSPTNNQEENLQLVTADSFKFKNYTVFSNFTMDISFPPEDVDMFVNEPPMFAQKPEFSYDKDGRISTLFTINLRSILLRKSVFADKLFYKNPAIVDSLVPTIVLSKVAIYKKKIRNIANLDELGDEVLLARSNDDVSAYNFTTVNNVSIFFKEMMLDTNPKHRSFGLYEKLSNNDAGIYQYRIEIEFIDPTRKYLYNYLDKLNLELFNYKSYVELVEARTLHDQSSYLPSSLINSLLQQYPTNESSPWSRMIACYLELWQLMVRFNLFENDVSMIEYSKKLLTFCHPSVATKKSLRIFQELVSKGISEFVEYFELDTSGTSEVAQNANFVLNSIQAERIYNTVGISTAEHKMLSKSLDRTKNIEYLPNSLMNRFDHPFPTVEQDDLQSYLSMNQYEIASSGYFYSVVTPLGSTNAFRSEDASVSYLSPLTLNASAQLAVNVSYPENVNQGLFSRALRTVLGIESTTTNIFEESIEAADADPVPVSDLLGENSDFDQSDQEDIEEISTAGSIELFNVLPFATKASLSINSESTITSNGEQLRKLPKSIKTVMNNQQGFLDSNNSFIESPRTSQIFRLGYLTPTVMRRLECQEGTNTARMIQASRNYLNLQLGPNPIFINLNYMNLNLSGISDVEISSEVSPLTHTDGSTIPIANQTFILYSNRLPTMKNTNIANRQEYSVNPAQIGIGTLYNQEYITSNPIKQLPKKNSFLGQNLFNQQTQDSVTTFADVIAESNQEDEQLPDANTEQVQVSGPQAPSY